MTVGGDTAGLLTVWGSVGWLYFDGFTVLPDLISDPVILPIERNENNVQLCFMFEGMNHSVLGVEFRFDIFQFQWV